MRVQESEIVQRIFGGKGLELTSDAAGIEKLGTNKLKIVWIAA